MERIGVLGAGTMGAGIIQVAALSGLNVTVWGRSQDRLERAVQGIKTFVDRSVERGRLKAEEAAHAMSRITLTTDTEELRSVDCAIETLAEDLALKKDMFTQLDRVCQPGAILATNTSSLSVTELASATSRPSQVVGLHFFNPVPLMGLVEVVKAVQTSEETMEAAVGLVKRLGKAPVQVKDTPGFIVNRVARPFYNEALRVYGDGVTTYEEIDRIMKLEGSFRMGPFELMDLIGNDVNFATTSTVYQGLHGEPKHRPHFIQQRMVQAGHLGRKTKKGFYTYE